MGKGSNVRPSSVDRDTWSRNWERTFGKLRPEWATPSHETTGGPLLEAHLICAFDAIRDEVPCRPMYDRHGIPL